MDLDSLRLQPRHEALWLSFAVGFKVSVTSSEYTVVFSSLDPTARSLFRRLSWEFQKPAYAQRQIDLPTYPVHLCSPPRHYHLQHTQ